MKIWSKLPLFWRFQLAGWTAFVVVTLPLKFDLMGGVSGAFLLCVVRDGSSFLLTVALRSLYRAFWSNKGGNMALLMILACTGAGIIQCGLFYPPREILPLESEVFRNRSMVFVFYERTGLLFGWSFLYFGIRHFIEGTEKRLQLALLEIQMLRAQMNPHFLFNALNTLQADVEKSPENSKRTIQAMADYLRYSLETRKDDFVPLEKEIAAIRDYLIIEENRFRGDLDFDFQIEGSTQCLLVPGIVIQPLVENAIKYGRMTSPKPVTVRLVTSLPEPRCLRIEVSNTGHWVEQEHHRPEGGIGLENLRRRLALLYPVPPKFCVLKPDGWVTVQVELPIRS